MKKVYDIYTEVIRDHFKVFYANWPIGEPVKLGDYGIMSGRIFICEGNIEDDYNIKFKHRTDTTKDRYYFKSNHSAKVEFFPKGSFYIQPNMPNIKASMKIEFGRGVSVFFNASGIKNHSIADFAKVEENIFSKFKQDKWSEKKVVVNRLVQADSTTIIISGKSGASICLDAESKAITNINLADASIRLSVRVENGVAFEIISEDGLFPMIGIAGIKPKHIWPRGKDDFEFLPLEKRVYSDIYNAKIAINKGLTTYDKEFYVGDI